MATEMKQAVPALLKCSYIKKRGVFKGTPCLALCKSKVFQRPVCHQHKQSLIESIKKGLEPTSHQPVLPMDEEFDNDIEMEKSIINPKTVYSLLDEEELTKEELEMEMEEFLEEEKKKEDIPIKKRKPIKKKKKKSLEFLEKTIKDIDTPIKKPKAKKNKKKEIKKDDKKEVNQVDYSTPHPFLPVGQELFKLVLSSMGGKLKINENELDNRIDRLCENPTVQQCINKLLHSNASQHSTKEYSPTVQLAMLTGVNLLMGTSTAAPAKKPEAPKSFNGKSANNNDINKNFTNVVV